MAIRIPNKMTEDQKKRRAILTEEFMRSEFYKNHLAPYIDKQIEINNKVLSLDETDLERSFIKAKNKVTIFNGLRNRFEEWAGKKSKKGGI